MLPGKYVMMAFLLIQYTVISTMRGKLFNRAAALCVALTAPVCSLAQVAKPAAPPVAQVAAMPLTPVMGWNSWDSYGLSITEDEFVSTTDILHQQLQQYGWTYAVVDEGWYPGQPREQR